VWWTEGKGEEKIYTKKVLKKKERTGKPEKNLETTRAGTEKKKWELAEKARSMKTSWPTQKEGKKVRGTAKAD